MERGLMPIVRALPQWLSLYGVAIEIPPEWQDLTDYCVVPEGAGKRRLLWDEHSLDAAAALSWLEEKRALLLGLDVSEADVSPVQALYHPHWPTHGFSARLGEADAQVDLCQFALVRPHSTLTLGTRGPPDLTAQLPSLLASIAPWGIGNRLPPQRFPIFDASFAWPGALGLPMNFRFDAPDLSATLRARWAAGRTHHEEPDWQSCFALDPDVTVELLQRDLKAVQGGQLATPFAVSHHKLIWQEARWFAIARGSGHEQRLSCCEAQAQLGARHLKLQFRTDQAGDMLPTWDRLLASVVVEI
jgi:hypothetical protein